MQLKQLILVVACLFGAFQGTQGKCTPEEEENCQLPTCLCPSVSVPGNLDAASIPQIVYLTFDDAVNADNYPMYEELFFDRFNPNGEPITLTFFVNHEYTDYTLVHQLYRRGHEIGLHSITHTADRQYWRELSGADWIAEMVDQKTQLSTFAEASSKGSRAPLLQTGGDVMMGPIYGEIYYDCSRPTREFTKPGLWPYTMDYDVGFQDCPIRPCANQTYPGLWSAPMLDLTGFNGLPCSMLDECLPQPNTTEEAFQLLKDNFLNHYDGNRAPFGVFTHSSWLSDVFVGHRDGYVAFLDYLSTFNDVYIVSIPRALEWVKNPTTLDAITDFAPWKVIVQPDNCLVKSTCRFEPEDTPGFPTERYMTICGSICPNKYPWLYDPLEENGRLQSNKATVR